jgi:hypothetical protein
LLRRLQLCCYTTDVVDWVVWRPNHRAVLSSATTGPDLPVPTPRHSSPPAVPRLAPSGTAPCTVPRPKGPVYRLRGHWPFVYVMPQDVAVYRRAGRSSLTSWGTFRAARAVPGRDVLVTAILAFFAHESCELVRDVSHHGRTSAGHAHCHSLSSQSLGQLGRERALVVLSLSCGCTGRAPPPYQYCSFGVVGPCRSHGTSPGNRNTSNPTPWPRILSNLTTNGCGPAMG